MRKIRGFLAVFGVLLAVFSLSLDGNFGNKQDTASSEYGSLYEVVRVVDGDTIVVSLDGEDVKVRFIGVNTPESVHEDESKNSVEGVSASDFTKELLADSKVYLVYDEDKEDDYGRVLAYVYTEDLQFINLLLVEKGYAECMRIEPNVRYASDFQEAERAARAANIGFWENGDFPD